MSSTQNRPLTKKQDHISVAHAAIEERLGLDPDDDADALEFIFDQLALVWSRTQAETREQVAQRLDDLGDGRLDYVGRPLPQHAGEIEALGGMRGSIYGEATGAKWLAKIIRGETNDRGWLPSWRWDR